MILQFITAATSYIGQGHVYRTIALAQEMKKRGHECIIAATENTLGDKILRKLAPNMRATLRNPDLIDFYILDVPGPHHHLLFAGCTVYLDWTGDEQYDGAAVDDCVLKIYQGVPFRQPKDNSEKAGFDYAILWPDVVKYRGQERKEQIFFYSSQNNELSDKVLKLLDDTGVPIVQPQPGVERAIEELASSAVVVTFGGMTCLEACCLGIPQVAISTGPKHERQISALANAGAVRQVKCGFEESIKYHVCLLLGSWQQTKQLSGIYTDMSKAAMKCIDGKGVFRVADTIESLV